MDELSPVVADYIAVAAELGLKPDTVYRWAKAGRVDTMGHDERGRVLVSLDTVERVATERGLIG